MLQRWFSRQVNPRSQDHCSRSQLHYVYMYNLTTSSRFVLLISTRHWRSSCHDLLSALRTSLRERTPGSRRRSPAPGATVASRLISTVDTTRYFNFSGGAFIKFRGAFCSRPSPAQHLLYWGRNCPGSCQHTLYNFDLSVTPCEFPLSRQKKKSSYARRFSVKLVQRFSVNPE